MCGLFVWFIYLLMIQITVAYIRMELNVFALTAVTFGSITIFISCSSSQSKLSDAERTSSCFLKYAYNALTALDTVVLVG